MVAGFEQLTPGDHLNGHSGVFCLEHPTMNTVSIDESCARLRLSLALVLARAVKEMFSGTRLGGVAVTAEGFHCDFELPVALTESHLPLLEDRMRGLIRSGGEIVCVHMARGEALERCDLLPLDGFRLRSIAGAYWQGDPVRSAGSCGYAGCA